MITNNRKVTTKEIIRPFNGKQKDNKVLKERQQLTSKLFELECKLQQEKFDGFLWFMYITTIV